MYIYCLHTSQYHYLCKNAKSRAKLNRNKKSLSHMSVRK